VVKISKADSWFSKYIRERDLWVCQRCKRKYAPPTNALHCAHMHTRRNRSTRWDERNACALCYGCHQFIDSHPHDKVEFFRKLIDKKFGKGQYDKLYIDTNITQKIDEGLMAIVWKDAYESLRKRNG
jgi:hypothetical protein